MNVDGFPEDGSYRPPPNTEVFRLAPSSPPFAYVLYDKTRGSGLARLFTSVDKDRTVEECPEKVSCRAVCAWDLARFGRPAQN